MATFTRARKPTLLPFRGPSGLPLRRAWQVATWSLLAVAGLVGFLLGGVAIVSAVRGEQLMIITSGSMEPAIPVASVVFVAPTSFYDLTVGDIITYAPTGTTLTTHRIIETSRINGALFYRTQGDANRTPDPNLTHASAVAGKVTFTIPLLGRLLDVSSTIAGRFLLVVLPVLILTGRQLRSHFGHKRPLGSPHDTLHATR
jgi:signal peptidase I